MPRVRVYMGCSFDGFIAGAGNDLSWLQVDRSSDGDLAQDPGFLQFSQFMGHIGAVLMGRSTYDAIERMGEWVYGDIPVIVATHRRLNPMVGTIRSLSGRIEKLVADAGVLAGDRDVYLDGGQIVCQALNAGLVDEITITSIPVLLARGIRLFEGLEHPHRLQFTRSAASGNGMLQVTARVVNTEGPV